MENDLKPIREAIDKLDLDLVRLLNERMRLVQEVGRIKADKGLALFDPNREEAIYQHLTRINTGPLSDASLQSIYREIFAASRMLQYPLQVALPGMGKKAIAQGRPLICGCLVDPPIEDLPRVLNHPAVDLVEWRLDLFAERHTWYKTLDLLQILASTPRHSVLVTNRPKEQGGAFDGPDSARVDVLKKAVELGAEWVDLEENVSKVDIEWFLSRSVGVVLSHHDFSGTPDLPSLGRKLEIMAGKGAKVVKIVTYAASPEDNLRTLQLIPLGRREFGVDVIAFCMGPLGRWSRLVGLLLGSPWGYVRLPEESESAPGQYNAYELRALWETLV